jgi:hypothetical protein
MGAVFGELYFETWKKKKGWKYDIKEKYLGDLYSETWNFFFKKKGIDKKYLWDLYFETWRKSLEL